MNTALSLTTKRVETTGVEIDGVLYPFALSGLIPAEDLDHVLAVAQWFAAGIQLIQGTSKELDPSIPTSTAEMEQSILKAARICLPDAPEDAIKGVGRDGMVQVIVAFLAHARGRSFPLRPTGSNKATKTRRKP